MQVIIKSPADITLEAVESWCRESVKPDQNYMVEIDLPRSLESKCIPMIHCHLRYLSPNCPYACDTTDVGSTYSGYSGTIRWEFVVYFTI